MENKNKKIQKYRVICGYARTVEGIEGSDVLFEEELNKAFAECYYPVFTTFRATAVPGNVVYTVITELNDTPEFLGGGTKRTGFSH
jgi:hypothetical protein